VDEARTSFGAALLVKILLVILLLGTGGLHYIALRPARYQKYAGLIKYVGNFGASLRIEAALALAVLIAAGLLAATPVPVPDFAEEKVESPTAVQTADGLTVVLTLTPGGPGVNTYDTTITRSGERVGGLQIRLSMVYPARDLRSAWQSAEPAEAGLYVAAGDEIDRTGRWWTLMDMTDAGGKTTRLAFEWDISDKAAVIESVDPRMTNLIALGLVVAAILGRFRWRGDYIQTRPESGDRDGGDQRRGHDRCDDRIRIPPLEKSGQTYDETLNPIPEVVNAVLPTQASLDRGAALYAEGCIGWEAVPRDFDALRDRLDAIRDEELFYATRDGWRGLPPCDGDLSIYQRWDVVNYLRTIARG
jgi:hypothetical protein